MKAHFTNILQLVKIQDGESNLKEINIFFKFLISEFSVKSIFVESTNPEINNLLSKGDKINYQILGIYSNTVYINLDYKGFSKTFKMLVQKK